MEQMEVKRMVFNQYKCKHSVRHKYSFQEKQTSARDFKSMPAISRNFPYFTHECIPGFNSRKPEKADVYSRCNSGLTPLQCAVFNNSEEDVQLLLANGADPNYFVSHISPLSIAVYHNLKNILQLLLNSGANVNVKLASGETALHIAADLGHEKFVRHLLDNGANVNAVASNGKIPLHYALIGGHDRIVRMLLKWESDINVRIDDGYSLLHLSAYHGNALICEALLNHGIDVNTALKKSKLTSLHISTIQKHFEITQLLLQYNADINAKTDDSKTPLYYAVIQESEDIVGAFLKNKRYIDYESNKEAFYTAILYGRNSIIKMLRKNGFCLQREDAKHEYLMFAAIQHKLTSIVQDLIVLGANPNVTCRNRAFGLRRVPIVYHAIFKNSSNIAKILLKYGADLDVTDIEDMRMFFFFSVSFAISRKNVTSLTLLLNNANTIVKSFQKWILFAKSGGSLTIMNELEKYSAIERMEICIQNNKEFQKELKCTSSGFIKSCLEELNSMLAAEPCEGRRLIDVLMASDSQIELFARNKRFVRNAIVLAKRFPIYQTFLVRKLQLGVERQNLLEHTTNFFMEASKFKLTYFISYNIAEYLSTPQLRYLVHLDRLKS